jgi:osmotically-inducible protein OsmY
MLLMNIKKARHYGVSSDIKLDVEDELRWDPDLDATDVAVTVKSGVVTLAGSTRSCSDKLEAEAAAKRVAGVLAVANDIEVRLPSLEQRPDPDIARDAIAAIQNRVPVVAEQIKVLVRNGWVTLEGGVEWDYQRSAVESAVRRAKGVKGVTNTVQVKPRVPAGQVKRKIDVFRRCAEIDANRITVDTNEGEVILEGAVRSWAERQEAERAAWKAPGVTRVVNHITIAV